MRHRGGRRTAAVLGTVCVCVGMLAAPAASAPNRHGGSSRPARTMLVFLRPRIVAQSARASHAAVSVSQEAVAGLAARLGAPILERALVPDELTMRLTSAQARALASDPLVAHVYADSSVPGPTVTPLLRPAARVVANATAAHAPCGTAAKPELDPEALANVDATGGATDGYDGAGVIVATLADGVDPSNPDLKRNAAYASASSKAGSPVTTLEDFGGGGTNQETDGAEAFGDVSSIAAQGNELYDLSKYVGSTHPLHAGCDMRIVGDAPGASVLALDVFGPEDASVASVIVQAINEAVARGARVINESFGFYDFPSTSVDIVEQADDAAVAAGVTVVVSSGDAGPTSTIGSPASDPDVLAVGATTTLRAYAQATFGGINALRASAGYVDNQISGLSSGGFAQDGRTVSLVAPGDLNWSLCSSSNKFVGCGGENVQLFGGTSESAPLTSGAAADVISAYEATHGGDAPTPQTVMEVLTSTAKDLDAPADEQGAGLLDVGAAVRLATSLAPTTDASPAGGIVSDTTQLDLSGAPGSVQSATVHLTNTSTTSRDVTVSTRALVAKSVSSGSVRFTSSAKQTGFTDGTGTRYFEHRISLKVARATARIQLQAAFAAQDEPVELSLFTPTGDLAAYSFPQGEASFADAEVSTPVQGTWTGVFFTTRSDGFRGLVPWTLTAWRFATEGTVGPGLVTLAPGETSSESLHLALGSSPGDSDLAVVISSGAQHTSIPVSVRTMIVLHANRATFRGELTGGNGRFGAPGETNTYEVTVPAGAHDLDAGLSLATNPVHGQLLTGILTDPAGSPQAIDDNATVSAAGALVSTSRFLSLYVADPAPGTWALSLIWWSPGAGTRTSFPFTGSVDLNEVKVSSDLPDSPTTVVPAAGEHAELTVDNKGVAPMRLSPDPRLDSSTTVQVPSYYGESATEHFPDAYDAYAIPTDTSSIEVAQLSSVPATFQALPESGDPLLSPTSDDPYLVGSLTTSSASATFAPPTGVPPGLWDVDSDEIGPYPANGEPSGTAIVSVHATMAPFDAATSSTVADAVEAIFKHGHAAKLAPRLVAPGATVSIPITIHPTAAAGTVVAGTLFLDGYSPGELFTNTLAAIPYEYEAP